VTEEELESVEAPATRPSTAPASLLPAEDKDESSPPPPSSSSFPPLEELS
jgi:hypothetical protein